MDITYRTARPEDAEAMARLDGSFTTHTVFEVVGGEAGFAVREVPVDPPVRKVFPQDEVEREAAGGAGGADGSGAAYEAGGAPEGDEQVFVALDGEVVCGFAAVTYAPWNRRVTVDDIEVSPTHRGRGIGRTLMEHASAFARERGAAHLWLEVSTLNAPAVHAYRSMGFALCGLDTALYDGTASAGEQALFMSRPCS
ncbi:GNAT family N-acetyltransferase [Streptomyces sp. NPDC046866]|uniref:GNAT family N-acetyltransferase n=1 Tax=Streptomyces sp. NPDC046866 TaxID=3154921 RepID=UPI003454BD25